MNLKTINIEKIKALKKMGVTHARTGIQTFNKKYRNLFSLSATVDQIYEKTKLLNDNFDFVCIDMLYGMNGQTTEEFIIDLTHAASLETKTIDLYPINNYSIQNRLHKEYKKNNLLPKSGLSKISFKILGDITMRSLGYLPHNGHGYVKATKKEIEKEPIVTSKYKFHYHEAVYGYKGHEVIGFGNNATSVVKNFVIYNPNNIDKYINDLLHMSKVEMDIYEFNSILDDSKGLILHLPYHGYIDKSKIDLKKVHPETKKLLANTIKAGLVIENSDSYKLTKFGWYWYVNLLYYLMPSNQKSIFNNFLSDIEPMSNKDPDQNKIDFQIDKI